MKKFALLLLSLTLCFALAACGGSDTSADEQAAADDTAASTTADESADTSATSDKQTAIDEFNATSAAFNEVANAINADPSAFDSDVIDTMQQMSDLLNQYQQMLSGDDEYTQEDLDKMTEGRSGQGGSEHRVIHSKRPIDTIFSHSIRDTTERRMRGSAFVVLYSARNHQKGRQLL